MSDSPQTPRQGVTIKRLFLYAAMAFVTISVLALSVFAFMAWRFVNNQEKTLFDQAEATEYVTAVAKDLALVRAEPFFQEVVKDEALEAAALNAGAVLNHMLSWNVAGPDPENPPAAAGLELPDALAEQVDDWGGKWLEHGEDFDPATVDFAWLQDLKQFRFWTLELQSPLGDALVQTPGLDPMLYPSPFYKPLTHWVKLRLLSALTADDPSAAFEDVRHLAHLCLTTPSLVSEMLGISYLSMLGETAEKLGQPHLAPEVVQAARRSFWGQQAYLDFTVPKALFDQVYPAGEIHPGACAAMDERLAFAEFSREVLGPYYEPDFQRFSSYVSQLQQGCRMTAARRHYESKATPLLLSQRLFDSFLVSEGNDPGTIEPGDGTEWARLKKIGPLRRAFGLITANLGKTDGLGPYQGVEPDLDDED